MSRSTSWTVNISVTVEVPIDSLAVEIILCVEPVSTLTNNEQRFWQIMASPVFYCWYGE